MFQVIGDAGGAPGMIAVFVLISAEGKTKRAPLLLLQFRAGYLILQEPFHGSPGLSHFARSTGDLAPVSIILEAMRSGLQISRFRI